MSTGERSLHIAREATYSTDPDPTGVASAWVPATKVGDIQDDKKPISMGYFTGRPWDAGFIPGPDGGSFSMDVPRTGLSAGAGDGVAPPAVDWSDELDRILFGNPVDLSGEGVATLAGTALGLDSAAFNVDDMALMVEGGLPVSWVPIVGDGGGGAYTLDFSPGAHTNAAVAFGYKRFRPVYPFAGSFAIVYKFDRNKEWTLLGCTITGYTETITQRGAVMRSLKIDYDRAVTTTKAIAGGVEPAATPAVGVQCVLMLDGVEVASKKTVIDLQPVTIQVAGHGGLNGRVGAKVLAINPKVTIEPEWRNDMRNARRGEAGDSGSRRVLIQVGGGDPSLPGGVLNTSCHYMPKMKVLEEGPGADGKLQRQNVTFVMNDPGPTFEPYQFFRA